MRIAGNSSAKLAGCPFGLSLPLIALIGVWLGIPWPALLVVFGLLPILGLLVGEDRSLPIVGLRSSPALLAYLDFLPRIYALVWMTSLAWAATYAARTNLSVAGFVGLALSVGIGSAVAIRVTGASSWRARCGKGGGRCPRYHSLSKWRFP